MTTHTLQPLLLIHTTRMVGVCGGCIWGGSRWCTCLQDSPSVVIGPSTEPSPSSAHPQPLSPSPPSPLPAAAAGWCPTLQASGIQDILSGTLAVCPGSCAVWSGRHTPACRWQPTRARRCGCRPHTQGWTLLHTPAHAKGAEGARGVAREHSHPSTLSPVALSALRTPTQTHMLGQVEHMTSHRF
jgi:hypothetical protein